MRQPDRRARHRQALLEHLQNFEAAEESCRLLLLHSQHARASEQVYHLLQQERKKRRQLSTADGKRGRKGSLSRSRSPSPSRSLSFINDEAAHSSAGAHGEDNDRTARHRQALLELMHTCKAKENSCCLLLRDSQHAQASEQVHYLLEQGLEKASLAASTSAHGQEDGGGGSLTEGGLPRHASAHGQEGGDGGALTEGGLPLYTRPPTVKRAAAVAL